MSSGLPIVTRGFQSQALRRVAHIWPTYSRQPKTTGDHSDNGIFLRKRVFRRRQYFRVVLLYRFRFPLALVSGVAISYCVSMRSCIGLDALA